MSIVRTVCVFATAALVLLLVVCSADALTCPKCYHNPRLCNWETWGYYPTQWRPWPQSAALDHAPAAHAGPHPVMQYIMTPTRPGDLRKEAEQLRMPDPEKPSQPAPPPPTQPSGRPAGMSSSYWPHPPLGGRYALPTTDDSLMRPARLPR